jgi:hypothetical protein
VRTGCAKALCRSAKGKRSVEVLGLSAHGAIANLQLVFPENGRATNRPKERSEQKAGIAADHANPGPEEKAAVAATDHANPGPGECSERTTAVTTTDRAKPGSGERSERKTNIAASGPGECSEQKASATTDHANP